ncbi:fungal-specific transcription factor domain-containing protein [Mycena olivaceomarginata]|nr:fungal-specific transcription factor domain-containing protein [Mycena olivaceomarginata]
MSAAQNSSDDSDSFDAETAIRQRTGTKRPSRTRKSKSAGACVHCKSLKVRCEFSPNETVCQRCRAGNYECLARTRKKRKAAPTHEDLQEQAQDQDRQIELLLTQLDQIRATFRMQQLMGGSERSRNLEPRGANLTAELAAVSYFSRGPSFDRLSTPPIIKCCFLYPAEIMDLFAIYFERVNPFFSILDQDLHGNPADLIWSSPFLFTVICATASRFYTLKPDLYPKAHAFARDAAAKALIDGSTGVDICQAYLILAVYPIPKKKFADDRSWLFMGVAIRMAIALGLNQPPPPLCDERESLNRTRTWLNCYCVDASHAIQFGKVPMLELDDYIARSSRDWYQSSNLNGPFDVHLCAYVSLILLMVEWRIVSAKTKFDIATLAIQTQEKLTNEMAQWVPRFDQDRAIHPLPICVYRGNTTQMITAYLRLVILADGFQHATKRGLSRDSDILRLSIDAARTVIQIALNRLYPTGNLKFAMEANWLYISFASAFLVNLLRPRFLPLVKEDTQRDIVCLVSKLIDVLGSDSIALDGRHTPALYSRFLSSLLAKYNVFPPQDDSAPADDVKIYRQFELDRAETPPNVYSWPDIAHSDNVSPHSSDGSDDFLLYQRSGVPDMDLSLNNFIRAVNEGQPSLDIWDPAWNPNRFAVHTGYM